jgi:hypothetical protein
MITTVFQAILDKLNGDATLQGYFGTTFFAYRASRVAPFVIPSLTLMENNEKSIPRTGYNAFKVRDNSPTIQIDVWVSSADESFPCTGEDADLIANRIDELLLNSSSAVTGTIEGSWQKTSSSQQHEESERIWHNALRYGFMYSKTDT